MQQRTSNLIIHAPNVHDGGGRALLNGLLSFCASTARFAQLDLRSQGKIGLPLHLPTSYVRPALWSRLAAEWRLWLKTGCNDVVLCFHGLPPLFRLRGRVVVFLQNRILITRNPLSDYPKRVRARLYIERLMMRHLSGHVNKYIVQTPSMAKDARITLGNDVDIVILPFMGRVEYESPAKQMKYDFVYVASGDPHKNHKLLLEAWCALAEEGYKPSLALTVQADSALARLIEECKLKYDLNISNLGRLHADEIPRLYNQSAALIFPSISESLGLPLIEAARFGLPILAPEMDYVRDVVEPVQTFDPHSSTSIARAVKRFIGQPEPVTMMRTPDVFLAEVMK